MGGEVEVAAVRVPADCTSATECRFSMSRKSVAWPSGWCSDERLRAGTSPKKEGLTLVKNLLRARGTGSRAEKRVTKI
jgi:hypothetical protein